MAATDRPAAGGLFTHKLGPLPVWVWIGVGAALWYLYQARQKAAAAAAAGGGGISPATQALANQGAAAAQYGYSGADIASLLSQLQAQVSMLGGGNNGNTTTGAGSPGSTGNPAVTPVSPAAPAAAATPFNPYPAGTVVAKNGEKIANAVFAGSYGWVDVTNQGGLYTSPGVSVSGSAYAGTPGTYSAAVQGSKVYEYTPTGVRTFSLTGKPTA